MVGNGLRPDIWEKFQKRFNIPKIVEFFGATEGTTAMVNLSGRVGAVGRISPLIVRQLTQLLYCKLNVSLLQTRLLIVRHRCGKDGTVNIR